MKDYLLEHENLSVSTPFKNVPPSPNSQQPPLIPQERGGASWNRHFSLHNRMLMGPNILKFLCRWGYWKFKSAITMPYLEEWVPWNLKKSNIKK